MRFLLLIMLSCCAFCVEPNRYYQTVPNHLVDELDAIVTAGELTPTKAELAVQRTLEKSGTHGAILSYSNVNAKMAAGIALLKEPKLTAIDKCRELIRDIDLVLAYWTVDVPGESNPNDAVTVRSINDANAKHRVKIDRIKAALSRIPETPQASAAMSLATKLADDRWVAERTARVIDQVKFALGASPQTELIDRIQARLTAATLRRPLALELMKRFTVDEMERLRALNDASVEARAMHALLDISSEITFETSALVSFEVKKIEATQAATPPVERPAPAKTNAVGGPSYRDVQPVVEAAIRALDDGDTDVLFRLFSPRDLRELDEKKLVDAKRGISERAANLRGVLVQIAAITPEYNADADALVFLVPGQRMPMCFQRIDGKWYITNRPVTSK